MFDLCLLLLCFFFLFFLQKFHKMVGLTDLKTYIQKNSIKIYLLIFGKILKITDFCLKRFLMQILIEQCFAKCKHLKKTNIPGSVVCVCVYVCVCVCVCVYLFYRFQKDFDNKINFYTYFKSCPYILLSLPSQLKVHIWAY